MPDTFHHATDVRFDAISDNRLIRIDLDSIAGPCFDVRNGKLGDEHWRRILAQLVESGFPCSLEPGAYTFLTCRGHFDGTTSSQNEGPCEIFVQDGKSLWQSYQSSLGIKAAKRAINDSPSHYVITVQLCATDPNPPCSHVSGTPRPTAIAPSTPPQQLHPWDALATETPT
ncbi:MAG: hypothetical protein MMC23_009978 [Stictis urceolatum]|nr:hypothetical protein [Stictis urceolata]